VARLIVFLSFLLASFPAHAQENFMLWLQGVGREAVAGGVHASTVDEALSGLTLDNDVIDLDRVQPERVGRFSVYSDHVLLKKRIAAGKKYIKDNTALLAKVHAKYGVPPEVLVALLGVESGFGHAQGNYGVVRSLASLAYEGRRAEFFRKELVAALKLLDEEGIPSSRLTGSWAGAMGQCQFMPTTYLNHAVDADGDGIRDIWKNRADVLESMANYLVAEGWKRGQTWGREARLTRPVLLSIIGLDKKPLPLSRWGELGLRSLNGAALPKRDLEAWLVQPDGPRGRSFLVYENYKALMKWNRSTFFATSVGLFADKIR
jgi:membrane-bound lytic murein transglycosylase B